MTKTLNFNDHLNNLKQCFTDYSNTCFKKIMSFRQTDPLLHEVCANPKELAESMLNKDKFGYLTNDYGATKKGSNILIETTNFIIAHGSPKDLLEQRVCTQPFSVTNVSNTECLLIANSLDLQINNCFQYAIHNKQANAANHSSATAALLFTLILAAYNYFNNGEPNPVEDAEEQSSKKLKHN